MTWKAEDRPLLSCSCSRKLFKGKGEGPSQHSYCFFVCFGLCISFQSSFCFTKTRNANLGVGVSPSGFVFTLFC